MPAASSPASSSPASRRCGGTAGASGASLSSLCWHRRAALGAPALPVGMTCGSCNCTVCVAITVAVLAPQEGFQNMDRCSREVKALKDCCRKFNEVRCCCCCCKRLLVCSAVCDARTFNACQLQHLVQNNRLDPSECFAACVHSDVCCESRCRCTAPSQSWMRWTTRGSLFRATARTTTSCGLDSRLQPSSPDDEAYCTVVHVMQRLVRSCHKTGPNAYAAQEMGFRA